MRQQRISGYRGTADSLALVADLRLEVKPAPAWTILVIASAVGAGTPVPARRVGAQPNGASFGIRMFVYQVATRDG